MKKRKIIRRQVYPASYDPIDKLKLMQGNGKKEVFWSLTQPMKEYYEEKGFKIEPYLYLVHTRRFSREALAHGCSFIKELHYGAIKGKAYIACRPKKMEMDIIMSYKIPYKVLKYRIILNP